MLASILVVGFFFQGPVVINEFAYDDSGTDDREYVELYNRSSSNVDISGWTLESEDNAGANPTYTIKNNTVLKPGDFYVLGSSLVPNVNQVVGTQDLWENSNETLTFKDKTGAVMDTLLYESNKGVWANAKQKNLIKGDGVWGNLVSVDLFEMSWQRIRDGFDFGSNRIFHLLPWSPGKSNNRPNLLPYSQNFDGLTNGSNVPNWGGSFRMPKVIDPTIADSENPNAIKASPQGKLAAIFWDNAGGGNMNPLLTDWNRNVVIEAWVYFDAKLESAGYYETWSLGIQGSTGTYFNSPDPTRSLPGGPATANGNTGVSVTYQVTDKAATLYLIDHNDGGWGANPNASTPEKILGQLTVTAGKNDGWQRLRFEIQGGRAEVRLGGTWGCGDGEILSGTISQPAFGGIYVGYREFILDNKTTRPFTADRFTVSVPSYGVTTYGTATKTTKGTPTIGTNGLPLIGATKFGITGSGLVPSSVAIYVLGAQSANIDLGAAGGQQGSKLLVLPIVLLGVPSSAQGTSIVPVPLPCDTGLKSIQLFWQILDIDPGLQIALPLGNSQGLTTTLGN